MNQIVLIGNLTRDPELCETSSGKKYSRFTLAVDRDYTVAEGGQPVDYFDCRAWNVLAENLTKYVRKGNRVAVRGPVRREPYEDGNGIQRTSFEVVAEQIEFLTPKSVDKSGEPAKPEPEKNTTKKK